MYKYPNLIKGLVGVTLALVATVNFAQSPYQGIGRTATPKEVMKWDIDVRPDFKGLPAGSGTATATSGSVNDTQVEFSAGDSSWRQKSTVQLSNGNFAVPVYNAADSDGVFVRLYSPDGAFLGATPARYRRSWAGPDICRRI